MIDPYHESSGRALEVYKPNTVSITAVVLLLFTACACFAFDRPVNLSSFDLSPRQAQSLLKNGCLVLPQHSEDNLWMAYRSPHSPVFVTSDAWLYLFYEQLKETIQRVEKDRFTNWQADCVQRLWKRTQQLRGQPQSPELARALRQNAVILAVALKLWDDKFQPPASIAQHVATLVRKVKSASEVSYYPGDDYTQYRVRGYYTKSAILSRYFRMAKWLSRRFFDIRNPADLRQAVAMAWTLRDNAETLQLWKRLDDGLTLLVGKPEGITPTHLLSACDKVWGKQWRLETSTSATQIRKLQRELQSDRYPSLHTMPAPVSPDNVMPSRMARIFPEYLVRENPLLQSTAGLPDFPHRELPTALDVMATLGSDRAFVHLQDEFTKYAGLRPKLVRIRDEWNRSPGEQSVQCIADGWLWALRPLLQDDPRLPPFMRTEIWRDKQLQTTLASWAQRRYLFILYTAPVYNFMSMSTLEKALVEPVPLFYHRLRALCVSVLHSLEQLDALPTTEGNRWSTFANELTHYEAMAEKELRGERLSDSEQDRVWDFGSFIRKLAFGAPEVVADIATNSQTGRVLHAAVGKFHPIIVLHQPPGKPATAYTGWVQSYYEFTENNFHRLTVEEWEQRLSADKYLQHPSWLAGLYGEGKSAVSLSPAEQAMSHAEELVANGRWQAGVEELRNVSRTWSGTADGARAVCMAANVLIDHQDYDGTLAELEKLHRMPLSQSTYEGQKLFVKAQEEKARIRKQEAFETELAQRLQATEPKKGLSTNDEIRRQDERAKTYLWAMDEHAWSTRQGEWMERLRSECPKSTWTPAIELGMAAREYAWWFREEIAEPSAQSNAALHDLAAKLPNDDIGVAAHLLLEAFNAGKDMENRAIRKRLEDALIAASKRPSEFHPQPEGYSQPTGGQVIDPYYVMQDSRRALDWVISEARKLVAAAYEPEVLDLYAKGRFKELLQPFVNIETGTWIHDREKFCSDKTLQAINPILETPKREWGALRLFARAEVLAGAVDEPFVEGKHRGEPPSPEAMPLYLQFLKAAPKSQWADTALSKAMKIAIIADDYETFKKLLDISLQRGSHLPEGVRPPIEWLGQLCKQYPQQKWLAESCATHKANAAMLSDREENPFVEMVSAFCRGDQMWQGQPIEQALENELRRSDNAGPEPLLQLATSVEDAKPGSIFGQRLRWLAAQKLWDCSYHGEALAALQPLLFGDVNNELKQRAQELSNLIEHENVLRRQGLPGWCERVARARETLALQDGRLVTLGWHNSDKHMGQIEVSCLARDGRPLWSHTLEDLPEIRSISLTGDSGRNRFFVTIDGLVGPRTLVHCFDLDTGSDLWQTVSSQGYTHSMCLYLASLDAILLYESEPYSKDEIHALFIDCKTHAPHIHALPAAISPMWVKCDENLALIRDGDTACAINRLTGEELWRGPLKVIPAIDSLRGVGMANESLLLATDGDENHRVTTITALQTSSGDEQWSCTYPGHYDMISRGIRLLLTTYADWHMVQIEPKGLHELWRGTNHGFPWLWRDGWIASKVAWSSSGDVSTGMTSFTDEDTGAIVGEVWVASKD